MDSGVLDVSMPPARGAGAGSGQRLFRGRRVLDHLGAQNAHRSTAGRGQPHGAAGQARAQQSRSVHRRDAARHHDGQPRPGMDRRACARLAARAAPRIAAGADLGRHLTHDRSRDRVHHHHRAPHRPRRAGAEDRRASVSREDVAARCQADGAVSESVQPVHPSAERHGVGGRPDVRHEGRQRPRPRALGRRAQDARDGEPGSRRARGR